MQAEAHAARVLELDPGNLKALLRLGQGMVARGEFQAAAKGPLATAHELAPENKGVAKELKSCKVKLKRAKAEEKARCAKMFA